MKRSCSLAAAVAAMVVASGAPVSSALAQAPGQVGPVLLEKRVPEELATEGVVLSRQGLMLRVEQVGAGWLASLVELNTGRVVVSTKLDALPADREAAVATMTQVVADLASQVTASASELADVAARAETERTARDTAEASYRRRAIRVGSAVPYVGELNEELAPDEFFVTVRRPDLSAKYHSRRNLAITTLALGGVAALIGAGVLAFTDPVNRAPTPACPECTGGMSTSAKAGIGFILSGVGLVGVSILLTGVMNPVNEAGMKTLADDYNQQLRRQLGLPVVSRRAPGRGLRLAPVLTGSGGGFALGGRF